MKSVDVSPSLEKLGMDSAQLVKYCTSAMIYLWPFDEVGGHVIKWTPHLVKGPMVMIG